MATPVIELAPGADANGFAQMLTDLLRQNLEAKPHKVPDFAAISGTIAIVVEDAEVALTMRFTGGKLVVHDGIVGIPDVSVRATSDAVLALSNFPITSPLALPVPWPRDKAAMEVTKSVLSAMRSGDFVVHGAALHPAMMLRLTRVMSVNG